LTIFNIGKENLQVHKIVKNATRHIRIRKNRQVLKNNLAKNRLYRIV